MKPELVKEKELVYSLGIQYLVYCRYNNTIYSKTNNDGA